MHAATSTHRAAFAWLRKPNIEHASCCVGRTLQNIYEKPVSCLPSNGRHCKGSIPRGLTMSVLALNQMAADRAGGDTAAKAWLRALAATAPIAAQPERTLAALIEELADTFRDAP